MVWQFAGLFGHQRLRNCSDCPVKALVLRFFVWSFFDKACLLARSSKSCMAVFNDSCSNLWLYLIRSEFYSTSAFASTLLAMLSELHLDDQIWCKL